MHIEIKNLVTILMALENLKSLHTTQSTLGMPGVVSVDEDNKIKVTFGSQNGDIFAAINLLQSMHELIGGEKLKNSDEQMQAFSQVGQYGTYRLGNATINRDEKGSIVVKVAPKKSEQELVEALQSGIDTQLSEIDRVIEDKKSRASNPGWAATVQGGFPRIYNGPNI